jgi:hypothetical protein
MFNARLTKLRLLQERALRAMIEAEDVAREKRVAWEKLWLEYLDEAERSGLCRFCLKPQNEGAHDGPDHMAIAAVA